MRTEKPVLAQKLATLKNYNNVLKDIEKYNRADTVNMNEQEMNKFRHIAGPAYLTGVYYDPWQTKLLGWGKEAKDLFFQSRGLEDTKFDLGNNQIGINIGLGAKDLNWSQKDLFDFIFKTQIEPYRK